VIIFEFICRVVCSCPVLHKEGRKEKEKHKIERLRRGKKKNPDFSRSFDRAPPIRHTLAVFPFLLLLTFIEGEELKECPFF
jgi:hypothetical protein